MNPSDVKEVVLLILERSAQALVDTLPSLITTASTDNNFNMVVRSQGAVDLARSVSHIIRDLPLNKSKEEILIDLFGKEDTNEPS
jgi:hypothetical protein